MTKNANDEHENGEEGIAVPRWLVTLLILGFAFVIVGITLFLVSALLGGGSASVGGVIFIGPFPIVFGAGPDAAWLITLSTIIAALSIVVFVVMRRRNWET